MPGLRFADLAAKPIDVLDMTSLTIDEFHVLMRALDAAFHAHMAEWCIDGKPRIGRVFKTYVNCPLPTAEDRLLFILVYLKTNPLQVAHGIMFGLPQGKTNQWIHLLLPLLQHALRQLGDAPSRSLDDLAKRLVLPDEAVASPTAPLFVTMEPNDESDVRKMRLNRKAVIAARKSAIR